MNPISVKAVIRDATGRVLFLRNPRGELELPGGRPESGESMEEALAREVLEECGLIITDTAYIGSRSCTIVPNKDVLLTFFNCRCDGDAINVSDEHTESQWVSTSASRPNDVPEYYWAVAREVGLGRPGSGNSQGDGRQSEYPLSTGERDRKRLLITAEVYDAGTREFLLPYLPCKAGRALEVGSGHGGISRWIAQMCPDATVVGMDSSAAQVELATHEAELLGVQNVRYMVEDLRKIEEWGGLYEGFDLITCRFTLLHLKDRERIVSGLLNRLSASGILVVEEPSLGSLFSVPENPAFSRANSAIMQYGRMMGLDYDCISEVWRVAASGGCTVRNVRFAQPTVWSRAHKELVLLSFMDFKARLVDASILDLIEANAIEEDLQREYMEEDVISGGLRTIQIALSKNGGGVP